MPVYIQSAIFIKYLKNSSNNNKIKSKKKAVKDSLDSKSLKCSGKSETFSDKQSQENSLLADLW